MRPYVYGLFLAPLLLALPARGDQAALPKPYKVVSDGGGCSLTVTPTSFMSWEARYKATKAEGTTVFEKVLPFQHGSRVSDACHVLIGRWPSDENSRDTFVLLGPDGRTLTALTYADMFSKDEIAKLGRRSVSHLNVWIEAKFDVKHDELVFTARCPIQNTDPQPRQERELKICGDLREVQLRLLLSSGKLVPRP